MATDVITSSLPPLVDPGPPLTSAQLARYSRHVILPALGAIGQRRLANARVLVVGAGGLGSPVLLYLAAAGVGTLGVVDDDLVDASNLQRQVVHGQSDVGRPKVDSAAEAIAEVNPEVTVHRHRVRLDRTNVLDLVAAYDLVIDGTDNFATRYLVNDACTVVGRPEVWGSIYRFDGQVSVFWSEHGPTYRDLFPEPPPPDAVPSCAEGGVLGVLCGAIGSAMATEAIKVICGIGEPLVGRLLVYDALAMSWRTVRVRPNPARPPVTALPPDVEVACAVPARSPQETEIDAATLRDWLTERAAGGRAFTLVDVREPAEREIVDVAGSVPLPLAELLADPAALPAGPLVLYCKSGARSARALAALQAAGRVDVRQLTGGVLAWVDRVEPDRPRY